MMFDLRRLVPVFVLLMLTALDVQAQTPTVTTGAPVAVGDLTATVNGTINPSGGTFYGRVRYWTTNFYTGLTASTTPDTFNGSSAVPLSVTIGGLEPNTLYHYKVSALSLDALTYYDGPEQTFTTGSPNTPPGMGTVNAQVLATAAYVSVSGVTGGSSTTTISFEYGLTASYGSSVTYAATVPMNGVAGTPGQLLAGLQPSTIYHYRCKATNSEGTTYSPDTTFTTLDPPVLTNGAVTGITDIDAAVNGTINPASGIYNMAVQYGPTTAYGSSTASESVFYGDNQQGVTFHPVGLQPSTLYHYRLVATDSVASFYGPDATFTTGAPATAPSMSFAYLPEVPDGTSAWVVVSGLISGGSPATVSFEYGTTTAYGSEVVYPTVIPTNTVANNPSPYVQITGLSLLTTYHVRCKATNGQGTTYSDDVTFTTAAGPVLTASAPVNVTDIAAGFRGTVNTGALPMLVTFEYGTTTDYGSSLSADPSFMQNSADAPVASTPPRLLPATTYHYRIKAVNQNNYRIYYSNDIAFTTAVATTPATMGEATVSQVSASGAVISGNVIWSGSSPADVSVEYGTTTAYGTSIFYDHVDPNVSLGFGQSLTGLTSGTDYHARVRITNGQGTVYSNDVAFTTAQLPTVTTGAATSVSDLSAVLSGSVNPNGASTTATVSFEFGTTTAYGATVNATPATILGAGSFSATANSLLPNTTYHYRAKVHYSFIVNVDYYGPDVVFTTAPAATPPTVGTLSFVPSVSGAVLRCAGVTGGSSDASLVWEYGPTNAYGSVAVSSPETVSMNGASSAFATLSGLTPATTYHFRLKATNNEGTATSPDATFTTLPAPDMLTAAADGITDIAAMLHGTMNPHGGAYYVGFEFGTDTNYGSVTYLSKVSGSATVDLSRSAVNASTSQGLLPSTTYHFRIIARTQPDGSGTNFYGADMSFTTAPPATPPTVFTGAASAPAPTAITLLAFEIVAGSSDTTLVFEYGLTDSYGSQVTHGSTIPARTSATLTHQLQGLTPNTTYHYRAKVTNNEGTNYGNDATFITRDYPTVTTGGVTSIGAMSAVLNGTYNQQGASYTVSFDYGVTTSYGSTASPGGLILGGGGGVLIGGGGILIGGGGIIIGGGPDFTTHTTSATATSLLSQTAYHYRLKLTDSYGNSYYGADATFTTVTPVEAWRLAKFATTDDAGDAADTANPSGDGIPNLMKYALGMDPATPGTLPQPQLKDYNGVQCLSLTFQRDPTKTDLTYEVQAADSPAGPWTTIASSVGGASCTGPGLVSDTQPPIFLIGSTPPFTVEVCDTQSLQDSPHRFMRLRVTR